MHIGWAMTFDPPPDGGTPSLQVLRDQTAERLELLPRFLQRLSSPRVGGLSLPTWEPDPHFEIAAHMRHATLPAPGGEAELLDWLGDFYSHRLDRARPLWETTLVDGLEGGRWALATKAHHCLVDGISGASAAAALLDAEPEPPAGSQGLAGMVAAAGGGGDEHEPGVLSRLYGAVGGGADVALHPRKLGAALSRSRSMAEMVVREELIGARQTSLNGPIGGTRRLAAVHAPLEDLKAIKRGLGGTVNDAVLAATAGGLRRLFEDRGESAEVETVRAMVPVSIRQAGEQLSLGNRVSSLFVDLSVSEPDPLRRYRDTVAAAEKLKRSDQATGTETLIEVAGVAPPLIHSVVARLAFTPRLFNLTITNVPGPPTTLYSLGAPMRRVVPLVPIFSGHAVGVAAVSYDGEVSFGLNADRATVPDLEVLRSGVEDSIDELLSIARSGATS